MTEQEIQDQLHLQLVNALQQYKGRTDIEELHAEFHTAIITPAVEVSFEGLMSCVSPTTVGKLLMWPSFVDFKNMVLSQDIQGLMLYIQALTYAGTIPVEEANVVGTYIGTVRPASFVQSPMLVAFDFYHLRELYGDKALGMPNIIPMEDFTLAMMEVNGA